MISRSSASARIAVPSFVKRRKSAVPTVTKIVKPSAMSCVPLTRASRKSTWKPQLVVGMISDRANVPAGQIQYMSPSRMRARPSVPIAFTSGSRAAKAGPNTVP